MKRIFLIIVFLIVLIGFDILSKDYFSNIYPKRYCIFSSTIEFEKPIIEKDSMMDYCTLDSSGEVEVTDKDGARSLTDTPAYILIYKDKIPYWPIVGDYLGIKLSYNEGIAFSLPIKGIFLQIITILAILGIFWHYIREEYVKNSRLLDTGYILILAGALSHAYERIFIGHVVDFIAVKYFAILNFADIFISIGAFFIIIAYVIESRKTR